MEKRISVALVILLLAFGHPKMAAALDEGPDLKLFAQITWIEKSLLMPKGAGTIKSYARHYAWINDSREEIYLLMIRDRKFPGIYAGIHLIDFQDFPFPRDGDCDVIHSRIGVPTKKIIELKCNPGA